ncbi:hypothetical protein [Bifidobacterium reuteri]|uniref:hypothetical protein n=1 Tax=Bifidobacterium reuteri TaxID=983706 RepID=UPI00168B52E4|nr:hypothetical protein [Bifidobacterium reuteri]
MPYLIGNTAAMRCKASREAGATTGALNKTTAKTDITGLNHADHASAAAICFQ